MEFLSLYCKIWEVIKAWIQAFNIFPGIVPHFWSYTVVWSQFFSGVILSNIMFKQVAFTKNSLRKLYQKLYFTVFFTMDVQ